MGCPKSLEKCIEIGWIVRFLLVSASLTVASRIFKTLSLPYLSLSVALGGLTSVT